MRPTVSAVIVAAGSSNRYGAPKLLETIGGETVLQRSIRMFDQSDRIDELVLVVSPETRCACEALSPLKPFVAVDGGETRVQSVVNGVNAASGEFVCIHDAARPLVSAGGIAAVVEDALRYGAAALCVPARDSIKHISGGFVDGSFNRSEAAMAQTPQVFCRADYIKALQGADGTETDDCEIAEKAGIIIKMTAGTTENIKITYPQDIVAARAFAGEKTRVGFGYDLHRLVEGRPLVLCGVTIPFEKGLLGHSDADAAIHALIDALLGAAALGDIGEHFPDTDPEWAGADSGELLRLTVALLKQNGFHPLNADVTVVAQQPKLSPYKEKMRDTLASLCGLDSGSVSVKAKTQEGLGFIGSGEAICAYAVASVLSQRG